MLAAAVIFAGCTKDSAGLIPDEPQGSLALSLGISNGTRAGQYEEYPWNDCDIRIYKYTYANEQDRTDKQNGRRELVRNYHSLDAMPAELWLAEGDYSIDATIGEDEIAKNAHRPFYYGQSEIFSIESGRKTAVEVVCDIQNTIVKVNFDKTVQAIFDIDYCVKVMLGNSFDESKADDNSAVTYTKSGDKGYFIVPKGTDKLSFCFLGHSSDPSVIDSNSTEGALVQGEIHEHYNGYALKTDKLIGYCYEINFKYSKDVMGFLSWDINITAGDPDPMDESAGINPAPKPSVGGDGFDINERQTVTDEISYSVEASDKPIIKVEVSCDGEEPLTVMCTRAEAGGIEVTDADESGRQVKVTLKSEYINSLSGGNHIINIKAYTSSSIFGEVDSEIRTQGTYSITSTDAWNAKGEIRAYVFSEDVSEVKIQYRKKDGGDWKTAVAEAEGDNSYKIAADDINANTEYEYQLLVNGEPAGAVKKDTMGDGAQIYNAGFETWSGTTPLLPYSSDADQWWDTGNHGSSMLNKNVTTSSTDAHSGRYSAKLQSEYVVLKFAAGNIFMGKYAGTAGTDGVIAFGKAFPFDYKPKALRFWYKSTIGAINQGSNFPDGVKKGDTDVNEIYIMLCNMDGPHIVNTSDKSTLVDPKAKTIPFCTAGTYNSNSKNDKSGDEAGHVIAYGVWNNTQTVNEWTVHELQLNYNEEFSNEKPVYLMLTASASKYGDYFVGYDKNMLQLDDIEFVY